VSVQGVTYLRKTKHSMMRSSCKTKFCCLGVKPNKIQESRAANCILHKLCMLLGVCVSLQEGAASRKKSRSEKYSVPSMAPPLPDPEVETGKPRKITQEIQTNRGLTPHRWVIQTNRGLTPHRWVRAGVVWSGWSSKRCKRIRYVTLLWCHGNGMSHYRSKPTGASHLIDGCNDKVSIMSDVYSFSAS